MGLPFVLVIYGLDIDILFFENLIINEKDLIIPHPRFSERLFVLNPMNEIEPDLKDPLSKKTIKELLVDAQNSSN